MKIYAIDPGNEYSALCVLDWETLRPLHHEKTENEQLYRFLKDEITFGRYDRVVIENLQSYGVRVGREVFDTAIWIGRFYETLLRRMPIFVPEFIFRSEEKMHICGMMKAKDADIRAALIQRFAQHDKINGKGKKNNPDWFYGFKRDEWAAYAVGVTYAETKLKEQMRGAEWMDKVCGTSSHTLRRNNNGDDTQ